MLAPGKTTCKGDDVPAKDQLDDNVNSQDAANGEQLNASHSV